jgi:predicted enzyme related to lactoylglutathione lyase
MARVTGVGGVFIRARDPKALGDWYRRHLGVPFENGFAKFMWRDDADVSAQTIWAPFDRESDYFGSTEQHAMINFRVDELDALLVELTAAGVEIIPERSEDDNGRFAWITDPEGNRIELWEPTRRSQ